MRLVVALGGNALLQRDEPPLASVQRRNVAHAAAAVASLARAHEVVVTHGNGPQVGLLARQASALADVPAYPLDALGAETEGLIGYWIELALRNQLPDREIATLLTQTEVAADDPAFDVPTKPIGRVYRRDEGEQLARSLDWSLAPDGEGVRRVVPSPVPLRVLEFASIERLLAAGALVVCAGGGGVPVVAGPEGLRGVEAVVDKDRVACELALGLRADALLLLTDVAAVYRDWPEAAEPFGDVTPDLLEMRAFPPGSMGPKVEAACRFAARSEGFAGIGELGAAAEIIAGTVGTRVRRAATE